MDTCALVYARPLAPVITVTVDEAEDRPDDDGDRNDTANGGIQLYLLTLLLALLYCYCI